MDSASNASPVPGSNSVLPGGSHSGGILRDEATRLANTMVQGKVGVFCKKFCFDSRREYRCTVDRQWGRRDSNAPLCDQGNATYLWMLEQLAGDNRLAALEKKGVASLEAYWHTVISSRPFWERFKDWRFGRRIRVPAYVKALDRDAHKVFWLMYDGNSALNIAQRLGRSESEIICLVRDINRELQRRNHAGLPSAPQFESLTRWDEGDEGEQGEIGTDEPAADERLWREQVMACYEQLSWQEQFVVDAMVVDGLSAKAVLVALKEQNICLDESVDLENANVQTVYYFLRKTLAKVQRSVMAPPGKTK